MTIFRDNLTIVNSDASCECGRPAYYVRLTQTGSDTIYRSCHISQIPKVYCYHELPETHWGSGVYMISGEGYLKLISANFDTSD